ncbi:MAG: hypothetical protein AAGB46_01660 [Verrucomicrobiota bacterium]
MTKDEFLASIENDEGPSSDWSMAVQGLWWDRKGEWDKAHDCCQPPSDNETDWLHAYLHRKEGDLGNASYWYRRSGKPIFQGTLDEEWEGMVEELVV